MKRLVEEGFSEEALSLLRSLTRVHLGQIETLYLKLEDAQQVAAIMALLDQHGVVVRQDIQDVETEPRGTSDDNRDCESERQ